MPGCAVAKCGNFNKKTKGTNIKYFRFPRTEEFSKKWIVACRREDKLNLKNACICSQHFEASCFEVPLRQRLLNYTFKHSRHLKPDALPTLKLPGSTCKTIGFGGCHTKGSSSTQRSDEEGSSYQPNLVPSTLLDSKSRNDESDSFLPEYMSENSMEVSSPRPDPLELKFEPPSTSEYSLPSNSADTEEETSFVNNPLQPLGVVNDAYTKFFLSMADTVRGLPPDLQITARRDVLHAVTECELTALSRCNGSKNN